MKTRLFLIMLLAASSAVAGEKAASADKPTAAPGDSNGVVCETKTELGSKFPTRVCTTEAERAAAKDKAQAQLQKLGDCSGNDSICAGEL
ncbi:hypothetical protein [Luteimonas sp. MC1828]|uniref:hypothetical protein n=1 Tax=Luteimonas sp. MC1828 TaxID=2799787 RepID=UPI0018F25280|nr:hypothetical protein [Luteimonas sp. MC1828]MBJ7575437.1 hypothetical protein [Luteimonas sp. MC1828]